ncbi:MAG: plasmid pRiA4b ORF-3 family protein [Elusimicrobia bacterium]|nr:plasmid pRiA4b ORF-3 family protein [Elusimicrobiota bacterium]
MKVATKRSVEKQKTGVTPKKIADTYQLKVTLDGIEPPIWRRLLVPGDINLLKLHEVLQVAMGWTNSHLHQFIVGDAYYVISDEKFESSSESKDERRYTLLQASRA